jgi:hypothetical protein
MFSGLDLDQASEDGLNGMLAHDARPLTMTREILLFATLLAFCACLTGAYLFAVLTQ